MTYCLCMRLVVNRKVIKNWTKRVGGTSEAVRRIMEKTNCAPVTADKIARGVYLSEPSFLFKQALQEITGLTEKELFIKIEEEQAS